MALILKFVYALITFISLSLVVTNSTEFPFTQFTCNEDNDCPRDMCIRNSLTPRCIKYVCAIHRSFSKGLIEGPPLGIKTSKAGTPMPDFLTPQNTRASPI
ncbi:hypothetical protein P8452_52844 [Trifolium repens]|nr:hypothetical protein P8452_52844 [Trifolium repens]